MKLSIVVPVHNESKWLSKRIKLLVGDLKKHNLQFELLLIENGSSDQSWAICRQLSKSMASVRLLKLPTASYGVAVRAGMT